MTRKLQNSTLECAKTRKRVLKPVVEKKRRDRINQSLAELRSLLLNHTSDPRLQNPKVEKAEILDLTVEYLQKWTDGKNLRNDPATPHMKTHVVSLHRSESSTPLFNMESAGFQQCVAQLTSYIQKITPSQRSSLIEGLKHHAESQQPNNSEPDFGQRGPETEAAKQLTSVDSICTSEGKEESTKSSFLSLSPFQPHLCSTPCHDYVSPPPSPWLSPSFSTYATSPPFSSFAPQFSSSPHSLSPLSSNTSFFSFSHTTPHSGPPALHCPPLTMLRPSPHAAPREWSPPNSSSSPMWRPWF